MKQDEKCFFCDGLGRIKYLKDGNYHTCNVCNGSGISYLVRYKKRNQGKNKCKYCGQNCTGYACQSCLNTFEKENNSEVEE